MSLPKDYQKKHSSIPGSYSWGGDCDYSKSREREKRTKYYLPVSMGFFVRVGFRGYDYLISR